MAKKVPRRAEREPHLGAAPFLRVDKPLPCVQSFLPQGELEGAKPASNRIKCRAKPLLCKACVE